MDPIPAISTWHLFAKAFYSGASAFSFWSFEVAEQRPGMKRSENGVRNSERLAP